MRGCSQRAWDDDYVLKRQFSALIPAFDPRPGRTNVNQTQDFEVPPPGSSGWDNVKKSTVATAGDDDSSSQEPRLQLSIRAPTVPGVSRTSLSMYDTFQSSLRVA